MCPSGKKICFWRFDKDEQHYVIKGDTRLDMSETAATSQYPFSLSSH